MELNLKKEKARIKAEKWRKNNPEKVAAKMKRYREKRKALNENNLFLLKKEKTCSSRSCKQQNPQPIGSFYVDKTCADGFFAFCKACERSRKKEYEKNNQEKIRQKRKVYKKNNKEKHKVNAKKYYERYPEKVRALRLKNSYNLTLDQYNKMLEMQNKSCAICRRHSSEFKRTLSVDHDHETGEVRGLLCSPCNTAIGLFRENLVIIKLAASYIEKHNNTKNPLLGP